jgi:replicative DNA helicase
MSAAPDTFVFSPEVVTDLTVQAIRDTEISTGHYLTGIPQIDDHYVMHRPSKVNGIVADTSNGKTGIMNILARNMVALPTDDGPVSQLKEGEVVVYATWEDSVEELNMSFMAYASQVPIGSLYNGEMGQPEWERIMTAAAMRAETPLWLIGHSDMGERRRPRLTMTDIWAACDYIENKLGLQIAALYVDYLQRISRADQHGDMRSQFMGIMDSNKDLALAYGMDLTIGSQIGRDIDTRKWQQPGIHDAQETSNFEQSCDGMQSLWIPKRSNNQKIGNSLIEKTGESPAVFVSEHLMLINTLKQKRGKAPVLRAVEYWPEYNEVRAYNNR